MARFSVADADKYGGQGGGGFFSLKNDKDVARIRFLYNGIEDVQGLAVHQVEVDDKKRYVNCLREYGQPKDVCPLCAEGMFVTAKYFVPIYNEDEDRVQTWERGKTFGSKLSSICGRYPNLVTHQFEVERNGKPGDTSTTYEIFPVGDADDKTLEDFEMPEILGGIVIDADADAMNHFLDYGEFPNDSNSDNGRDAEPPVRRGRSADRDEEPRRRTPASTGSSRRGDRF